MITCACLAPLYGYGVSDRHRMWATDLTEHNRHSGSQGCDVFTVALKGATCRSIGTPKFHVAFGSGNPALFML